MRTFLQMKQALQRRARNTTISEASSDLQDWADDARDFLMAWPWESLKRTWTLTTVASKAEYGIADRISDIYVVKFTTDIEKILRPADLQEIDRSDPNPSTTTYPDFYYPNGVSNVQNQPSSGSVIRIQSSAGADTTQSVRVTGLVSSIIQTEEIALNGTTPVSGSLTFTEILELALDAVCTGYVTIDSNSAAVTNATIPPNKISQEFTIMGFYLTPSTAGKTITIRGHAELLPLRNDKDIWPEQLQPLAMQYIYARWLEYDGHERAPVAMAQLEDPLDGSAGPMLRRTLVKQRRSLDRTRYIQGGRRGKLRWPRLLDQDFPVGTW